MQQDTTKTGDFISIIWPISYTPEEAAESTGVSRTRIFNAIRERELTARKCGKTTVIEATELIRWVRSMPTRGREPAAA